MALRLVVSHGPRGLVMPVPGWGPLAAGTEQQNTILTVPSPIEVKPNVVTKVVRHVTGEARSEGRLVATLSSSVVAVAAVLVAAVQ